MIPSLKLQEDAVDRSEQLEQEYRDFAYIVSHDLNAPLRHVREFTRLLIEPRQANLSEEEQHYIEFLNKSLKKLEDMQYALLTFSRINTRGENMSDVDCNNIVKDVLEGLEAKIKDYDTSVEYRDLPTLYADPEQIQSLFFNLIDNALKFYWDDNAKRKVIIKATDQGDAWLFEIKDNGIGIDEKYHEDVFKMFRRLEPEHFAGVGAGLTHAKKIVEKHGGEIMINSGEDQDTSVFFILPK